MRRHGVCAQATELKKLNNALAAAQSELRKAQEQTDECKKYVTIPNSCFSSSQEFFQEIFPLIENQVTAWSSKPGSYSLHLND